MVLFQAPETKTPPAKRAAKKTAAAARTVRRAVDQEPPATRAPAKGGGKSGKGGKKKAAAARPRPPTAATRPTRTTRPATIPRSRDPTSGDSEESTDGEGGPRRRRRAEVAAAGVLDGSGDDTRPTRTTTPTTSRTTPGTRTPTTARVGGGSGGSRRRRRRRRSGRRESGGSSDDPDNTVTRARKHAQPRGRDHQHRRVHPPRGQEAASSRGSRGRSSARADRQRGGVPGPPRVRRPGDGHPAEGRPDPDRRARGQGPRRALRRARVADLADRQRLPRPRPERAALDGGGVHRHRQGPQRRALRRRGQLVGGRPQGRPAAQDRVGALLRARRSWCRSPRTPSATRAPASPAR